MKGKSDSESRVREPIQIYMAADERRLLDTLASETGLSRAEILRRGLKAFAAGRVGEHGPVQLLLQSFRDVDWPADVASEHDEHLVRAYRNECDE